MIGRAYPKIKCNAIFSEDEWKAVYVVFTQKKPPKTPPALGAMINMLGAFGGHLGRKHDGPPGIKSIWIGLQRMHDFSLAWQIMQTLPASS